VIIADRYRSLIDGYLTQGIPWKNSPEPKIPKLYNLPVEFSPQSTIAPCWEVINFELVKEPGIPEEYPYFRVSS
jgi:hypothetical protein